MTKTLTQGELDLLVSPTETTTYTLSVFYGDCTASQDFKVEVINEKTEVYLGNVFSPNSDRESHSQQHIDEC